MFYVTMHAAWMLLATAVGLVAGYQGLVRATVRPGVGSPLPGHFRLPKHARWGRTFVAMMLVGIAYGLLMAHLVLPADYMPPRIAELHEVFGISVGVLYAGGWVLGEVLRRRPAGKRRFWPRAHLVLNYTACTAVAVQIVVAVYYVWIWPNT